RRLDRGSRIVSDLVIHVRRKERFSMLKGLVDRVSSFQLIRPRQKIYGHSSAWISVQPAKGVVVLRAQLGSADVLHAYDGPVRSLPNDYVFELLRCNQSPGSA